MTSIVIIQALLFQDGGLLAMGANIFNMALVGVLVSHAIYSLFSRLFMKKAWGILLAGFLAAWTSIFIASLSCALQLALSGTSPANLSVPAMAAIHALIGVGEGLITIGALSLILAARKDLLKNDKVESTNHRGLLIVGCLLALVLAVLSPLASTHPDGLEWVAEQQGFLGAAQQSIYEILPDYTIPGINNPALSTVIAGIIGVVVVFIIVWLASRSGRRGDKGTRK